MKTTIIRLILIFFISIYLFLSKDHCANNKAKKYKIDNKNYCLLTANNQEQWEKGLMFYKKPVDFDGMIFIFPEKQLRTFWNMNTYMDLDIYCMDDGKIVSKGYLPSILKSKEVVVVKSSGKVNRIVEIVK